MSDIVTTIRDLLRADNAHGHKPTLETEMLRKAADEIERLVRDYETARDAHDRRQAELLTERARAERAEAERDALYALLARMVELAEYWIGRSDRNAMTASEWQTWHSLGYGSNALRDTKAALTKEWK